MRARDRQRRRRGRGHEARRGAALAALEAAGPAMSAPARHLAAAAQVPAGRPRGDWTPAPALTGWVHLEEEKLLMTAGRAPTLVASRRGAQEREMLRDEREAQNNERLAREYRQLAARAASRLAGEAAARHSLAREAVRVPNPPPAEDRGPEAEAARQMRALIAGAVEAKRGRLTAKGQIFIPAIPWLDLLIADGDQQVLQGLASNPSTPGGIVGKLIASPAAAVRRLAAQHPKAPLPALKAAAESNTDGWVRLHAAGELLRRGERDAVAVVMELLLTSENAGLRAAALKIVADMSPSGGMH